MGRGKHPIGRVVKAINFPHQHIVIAVELMGDCEHKGKTYGEGYYAVMDGENVSHMIDFELFRRSYFPICTWREYDLGLQYDDD